MSIPENEFITESEFVNYDLVDYQRTLGVCLPPTDETGAPKFPTENISTIAGHLLPNISPGPIPEKADEDMTIGNSID